MNILIIDKEGSGLDFAIRAIYHGHKVKIAYGPEAAPHRIGEGIVDIVDNPLPHARWADLIFCTDNSWLQKQVDVLIRRGFPVFGPSEEAASWELDRAKGQAVLKAAGVDTLPGVSFTSYDKAITYVKRKGGRYVSKPNGDMDKSLSYVSKNAADMVFMLERWKKNNKLKGEFILQEFVPGIEMAVGAFYANGKRTSPWLENFEFKKLMPGDLGVSTGEQGTVINYCEDSKLAQKVLVPVEPQIADLNYTGYIDVNCIIDDQGTPWPLEFTTRPGWPLFQIQQALHDFDMAQWMLDSMTHGTMMEPDMQTATGVVMSIPDYPYGSYTNKDVAGIPVYGMTRENRWNIHPAEMKLGTAPAMDGDSVVDKSMLVTAGDYVLIASGVGDNVEQSAQGAYEVLESLEVPNSPMYRIDIGKRLEKQLPELHKLGYATDFTYEGDD